MTMGNIPQDPMMLMSFINMKLRDFYPSLDALCEDLEISREELEERLGNLLGTKVTIKQGAKKGRIEIEFYDKESLEKIVNKLGKD